MDYIIKFILGLPIGERILYLGVVTYLIWKGLLVLPFVPINHPHKKIGEKLLKIWDIKTKVTLYEQMNLVEVAHASIIFKMNAIYARLTKNMMDIQHYELLAKDLEGECKSHIRKWLKENHYTDRSSTEFEVYIQEKQTFLLQLVILSLNKFYRDDLFTVTREELQKANESELIPFALEKWRKMFLDAREVSRVNEAKIKQIESGK